jgi:type III pantothenate kinase
MDLLAVDIGNSRIGWALWETGRDRPTASGRDEPAAAVAAAAEAVAVLLARSPGRPGPAVAVACVNPVDLPARLAPMERAAGRRAVLVARELPLMPEVLRHRLPRPEKAGPDRLAAALGASALFGPPTVTVNAGTAVTVDALSAAGEFLGGAILPGLRTQLWSLHARTARLPEVELTEPPAESLGRDTESAIAAGVFFGLAGAVGGLVARALRHPEVGPAATVVLAGGDAELLAPAVTVPQPSTLRVEPDIVLIGVREWVRRASAAGWVAP